MESLSEVSRGKVNYFIGNDPKKWKTNIPTYKAVVYKELYPGIDLKFYGNNRQMEYDIIVKPGADPSKVKFAYEGIKGLRVTDEGNLEISLKEGTILQKKPIVYQEIDGRRVDVAGTFKIASRTKHHSNRFACAFEVASYDKTHPLLIDPNLVYSSYLGESDSDGGYGIAVDASGNAYVTGQTLSTDFPTVSPYQAAIVGFSDAFVAKLGEATTRTNIKITNVAPRTGLPGYTKTVSVVGRGFAGATAVTFNCTPAGTVCSSFNFTFPVPILTNVAPKHGAGGAAVMIVGRWFIGATAVDFNGASATFTVTNNNVIKATVPTGASTGKAHVTTPYGTATSSFNFAIP